MAHAARRCSFQRAAIPTRLRVAERTLFVIVTVPDRDVDGALLDVTHRFPLVTRATFELACAYIHMCVSGVWQHELEEAMRVDGVTYRDPHSPPLGGPGWTTYRPAVTAKSDSEDRT